MAGTDPGRWNLSDVKNVIECATNGAVEDDSHVINTLRDIAKLMEDEKTSNFILGKVIIDNDLLTDDDEVDDE